MLILFQQIGYYDGKSTLYSWEWVVVTRFNPERGDDAIATSSERVMGEWGDIFSLYYFFKKV